MDASDFRRQWGAGLTPFPSGFFANASLPAADVSFLTSVGLPAVAAPFLSFGPGGEAVVSSVAKAFGLEAPFDDFECDPTDYWVIGGGTSGDPVALDSNGKVWGLNHDAGFEPYFLASSVSKLGAILLAFREHERRAALEAPTAHQEANEWLYAQLDSIDAAASDAWQDWIEASPEEKAETDREEQRIGAAHDDIDAMIQKIDTLPPDVL